MWCFEGLLTFSGVLHTEEMKSLGTKVCFDYVWKPGDSRGWDRGWDCLPSPVSQRHITLFCPRTNPQEARAASSVPGCLTHPGHTAADSGGHFPELALTGDTVCQQWLTPCLMPLRQIFGTAAAFADDMVTWLTQLKEPCIGDRPMCAQSTKRAFAFCCMKSGTTKCEIEHVFGKKGEHCEILCHHR